MPDGSLLSTYGPQTKDQFLSSVKTSSVDPVKMNQSSTSFDWVPQNDPYWMPKTKPVDQSALPAPAKRTQIAAKMGASSSFPVSGEGASPVQLKQAVKHLSSLPFDNPLVADSLLPTARATFDKRRSQVGVPQVAGQLLTESFVKPLESLMTKFPMQGNQEPPAPNPNAPSGEGAMLGAPKAPDISGPITPFDETGKIMSQKVADLIANKKFSEASQVFDEWQNTKINNMDPIDLLKVDSNHPVLTDLTHGLSVATMQFVALRNAPFLGELGNMMDAKVATTLGSAMNAAKTADAAGETLGLGGKILSRTTTGMAKMASTMAGDLPANFVQPVMNFDFQHRPLKDLPKDVLTQLALLVPATLTLHYAGEGMGRMFSNARDSVLGGVDPSAAPAAHPLPSTGGGFVDEATNTLTQATIKAATKVAGMLKALRVPLSEESPKLFEQGVLGEADNAFSRIVDALPEEDQTALRNYFGLQRQQGEMDRMSTRLNPEISPSFSFGEARPAGIGGPKPDPLQSRVPKAIEDSANVPEVTPAEKEMMTRTARTPADIRAETKTAAMQAAQTRATDRGEVLRKKGALDQQKNELNQKYEFERMVSDVRQFREGIRQGHVQTLADVKAAQTELEGFINDSLPPKYRSRAMPLIKKATNAEQLGKAVDKLNDIVQKVKTSELGLGAERGAIKRATKAGIKDVLENPPPEIELVQPYQRSIWFRNLLELPFGKEKSAAALNKAQDALTKISTDLYSSLTPVKDMEATWAAVKQFPKQVSSEIGKAQGELDGFFKRNFVDHSQVDDFARYRTLKMMSARAEQGATNPGSVGLRIPDNPSSEWLSTAIADMEGTTPALKGINSEFNDIYNRYTLDQYKGRVPQPVLDEWKKKYPDHVSFFYKKYMQDSGGHPQGKSYNFSARDYLTAIKGGEGLDLSANIYDSTVRSFQRAISDKYTDQIAHTVRSELGINPLKMYETGEGRRRFQAIVKGKPYDFDVNDLNSDTVPGLKGQRVMYSAYDDQAFLVPEAISKLVKNEREKSPAILNAFSALTHKWQDMTTTYRASFALISNPIKDLEFAMVNTDHSVKDFLKSYLTSTRDLLANSMYSDNPTQLKRMVDGSFAIDDSLTTKLKGKFQDTLNWMANKVGTDGWEQFSKDFAESGGNQGGYITSRTKLDNTEKSFFKNLGTVFTGKDAEYSVSSVDPKFIANSGIRNFVRLKNGVMALTFDQIADAGSFMEKIPRAAEFKLALKAGESLQSAGAAASDITLDFTEQGSSNAVKWIRAFLPYKFTAFRGNAKLLDAAIGKGREGMAATIGARRILTGIVMPAIGTWFLAKKSGIWDRSDTALQNNYWMIPTGMTYKDEYGNVNPIILTPRMGEMTQKLAPLIFTMLDHFVAKDPSAFNRMSPEKFRNSLYSALTPLLRTPLEVRSNFSYFYNQPIDPSFLQDLPVQLRRYKGTTAPGTLVGNLTGISPNQGDYVLQSLFPAPFDYYKQLTKDGGDKPNWLTVAESLKLLQQPNPYFADKDLNKARQDLMAQLKKTARQANVSPAEREQVTREIWTKMKALDDKANFLQSERTKNPLQGTQVNQPGVDMQKMKAFAAASPTNRKAMMQTLSPDEVQYLRSRKK